eukprot:scaffold16823_cov17-Tisochrysis_lutea.AAC.3
MLLLLPLCVCWLPNTRLSSDEVPGERLAVLKGVADAYLLSSGWSMAGVICVLCALCSLRMEEGATLCPGSLPVAPCIWCTLSPSAAGLLELLILEPGCGAGQAGVACEAPGLPWPALAGAIAVCTGANANSFPLVGPAAAAGPLGFGRSLLLWGRVPWFMSAMLPVLLRKSAWAAHLCDALPVEKSADMRMAMAWASRLTSGGTAVGLSWSLPSACALAWETT